MMPTPPPNDRRRFALRVVLAALQTAATMVVARLRNDPRAVKLLSAWVRVAVAAALLAAWALTAIYGDAAPGELARQLATILDACFPALLLVLYR